jgi:hypothetical protein
MHKHADPGDFFVPAESVLLFHCPLELEFPVKREICTASLANIVPPLFVPTIRSAADQDGATGDAEIGRLGVHAFTIWMLGGVAQTAPLSTKSGRVS